MKILCFAKEKRFVQMNEFQELSMGMIDIANQAQHFRKQLMIKWFANLLGDDEKPVFRSSFRSMNPRPVDVKTRLQVTEKRVNKHIKKLSTFIRRRRMNRQQFITDTINK